MGLYETLKAAKLGAAPDVLTTLRAQIAPFAKGGSTPTEKEMEDTPPLSFSANGQPLIDWSIDGASGGVGDATPNLFNKNDESELGNWYAGSGVIASATTTGSVQIPCKASTTYTIKKTISSRFNVFYTNEEPANGVEIYGALARPTQESITITTGESAMYLVVFLYHGSYDTLSYQDIVDSVVIVEGSTAPTDYIPYGYQIPVTCGGETKTIYLDEPLGASDSISMTDTGISIPTVDGSNTLSVGTTVQPSEVYIKWKG